MMLQNSPRRPSRYNVNKRRIFRIKKLLKLVLYRIFHPKHSHQDSKCHIAQNHGCASRTIGKIGQIGATKRYFNINSSVADNDDSACAVKDSPSYENQARLLARTSQSNKHNSTKKQKVGAYMEEDNKPLNSRSLPTEATSSNAGCQFLGEEENNASTPISTLTKNAEEDSILSSFLWELLVKTLLEKQNQAGLIDEQKMTGVGFSELLKNKRELQQTKQLLFDCINEAIEIHGTKSRNWKNTQEFMGLQELGKIIYEKFCSWANQNSAQKINFDVSSLVEGWNDMNRLHRKIGIEIGDDIMDEVIQEVIDLFFQ